MFWFRRPVTRVDWEPKHHQVLNIVLALEILINVVMLVSLITTGKDKQNLIVCQIVLLLIV